jgi:hypothetical protein
MASGLLVWHPPGTNYVESPWLMKVGESVYLGGHAGFCCNDYSPDAQWVIRYPAVGPTTQRSIVLPDAKENDDHEVGGYSPLIIGGRWFILGQRTERSYWGQGNRLRPFYIDTPDPFSDDMIVHREPLFYPVDLGCKEMGDAGRPECSNSIGAGQQGTPLTTRDGRLLVMSKDDVSFMNWRNNDRSSHVVHEINPVTKESTFLYESYWGCEGGLPGGLCPALTPTFYDWARVGQSYILRGYTGDMDQSGWYQSSTIVEWDSWDEGRRWYRTGRTWKMEDDSCLWDAAVMRDASGALAEPLTFAAVHAPRVNGVCEWATSGTWNILWWTEDKAKLPPMFGNHPNIQVVRKQIRRR